MNKSDELRAEYPEELVRSGVRGKYAAQYHEKSNIVVIDAELVDKFPNSKSVNDALRQFLAEHKKSAR